MTVLAPKSVLQVGENETVHRALADLAASQPLQIDMALDQGACLAQIAGSKYDLVLTDAETSGADDVELLAQFSRSGQGPK